jgi:hypothetical protein
VVRHIFQAFLVWIYTQSNITCKHQMKYICKKSSNQEMFAISIVNRGDGLETR